MRVCLAAFSTRMSRHLRRGISARIASLISPPGSSQASLRRSSAIRTLERSPSISSRTRFSADSRTMRISSSWSMPQLGDLGVGDRAAAVVLVGAAAREHARADHDAALSRRDAQRSVAHVAGLLAEDRAQQALLGRELRLALRRDLPDQDVVGIHFGADPHDARLVEVRERLLADVRDVARDLLATQLGVARDDLELLDVDRGEQVVLHDLLGDQDRVLEVVPAPGHEGDEHVAAERELAAVGGRAVGDHLTLPDLLADLHDRLLVDARVLVRAAVLHQVDDVRRRVRALAVRFGLDDDAGGVHALDDAAAFRDHGRARVARDHALHAGAHDRGVGAQERQRLALHVRAHQRAVRVVVLEERDQRRRDRDELVRRHVHHVDLVAARASRTRRSRAPRPSRS